MTGILDNDRSRTRRERTFVGSECAVCEEPLEHTLRGERILQFSCGHVSHGACFYEYIKEFDSRYCPSCNAPLALDTSRGGNVLDIEKLSSMVRSVSVNGDRASATPTPTQWDNQTLRPPSYESNTRRHDRRDDSHMRNGRESAASSRRDGHSDRERYDRYGTPQHNHHHQQHQRSDSEATGSNSYPDTAQSSSGPTRRHDYDVQSMETNIVSQRSSRNPIPPPIVSIRSEFPTLNRSRAQQTLACLITVEVPDNNWRPDPEDVRAPPIPKSREEERFVRPPSPVKSTRRYDPYESPEVLEKMTESLRTRVENWHSLDFSR